MSTYTTLRDANTNRQIEWDTKNQMDLSYSGNELAGEAGELIQAVSDILNGGDDMEAVRQELGDVTICCDLIAGRLEVPLVVPEPDQSESLSLSADSIDGQLIALAIQIGMVCNTIKKQERARLGMVGARGSLDDLRRDLDEVVMIVHSLATAFGFSAKECAAHKFNLTSEKYGLKTRMAI